MTTTTNRAMDHLSYAEQVALHAGEGWMPALGYEDRGLDQGNLRIFQEDLGARSVEVFIFDEHRVLEASASFSNLPPSVVGDAIARIRSSAGR